MTRWRPAKSALEGIRFEQFPRDVASAVQHTQQRNCIVLRHILVDQHAGKDDCNANVLSERGSQRSCLRQIDKPHNRRAETATVVFRDPRTPLTFEIIKDAAGVRLGIGRDDKTSHRERSRSSRASSRAKKSLPDETPPSAIEARA